MNAVGVACSRGDFRARCARRHDDPAAAVDEDDVGAVGFGEAWRGLVEFLGVHVFEYQISDFDRKTIGEGKSGCGRRLTERKTPPFQGKSLIVSILDSDCDACKPLGVS